MWITLRLDDRSVKIQDVCGRPGHGMEPDTCGHASFCVVLHETGSTHLSAPSRLKVVSPQLLYILREPLDPLSRRQVPAPTALAFRRHHSFHSFQSCRPFSRSLHRCCCNPRFKMYLRFHAGCHLRRCLLLGLADLVRKLCPCLFHGCMHISSTNGPVHNVTQLSSSPSGNGGRGCFWFARLPHEGSGYLWPSRLCCTCKRGRIHS